MRYWKFLLLILLVASLTYSAINVWHLATQPATKLVIERGQQEIATSFEKAMAKAATPKAIDEKLANLLEEETRNWVVIEAIKAVSEDRSIQVSPGTELALEAARHKDFGILQTSTNCIKCALVASQCELSIVMVCQVAVQMTPIGDIAGVAKGGWNYYNREDVDEVDVILSVVGLTAVAAAYPSGGSSLTVKAGAGMAKTLNSMNALPGPIRRQFVHAMDRGVDWSGILNVRGIDDLIALVRADVMDETVAVVSDLGKVSGNLRTTDAIQVMRSVDNADELRTVSKASDVLRDKTVGTLEILGKNRFLRATLKWSDEAIGFVLGLVSFVVALVGLMWSGLTSAFLRRIRRVAHTGNPTAT